MHAGCFCCWHSSVLDMNVRIFLVHAIKHMCAQTRSQFILLFEFLGNEESLLTPREISPLPEDNEPKALPAELFWPQTSGLTGKHQHKTRNFWCTPPFPPPPPPKKKNQQPKNKLKQIQQQQKTQRKTKQTKRKERKILKSLSAFSFCKEILKRSQWMRYNVCVSVCGWVGGIDMSVCMCVCVCVC